MAGMRKRLVKDERGFTLSEMMVTIMIMVVVFFALYSIFDMSLKVFSFGNNKIEAVESARIGLEKMEREIRQAYKFNSAASPPQNYLFFTTTANPPPAMAMPAGTPKVVDQLTFGNELGDPGDRAITCVSPCEYITYKLTDSAGVSPCNTAPCTLRRVNTSNSADLGAPVVENVAANGLSFTLLTSNGGTPASEATVGMVLVKLNVVVKQGIGKSGTQTLTTVVDLRNR
jgi:prepilin-type N-terminal cleavage/methylation domain-containing protein